MAVRFVYFACTVTFSKTLQEHITHTKMVLTLFKQAGVALKVKKYAFVTNHVEYLGQVIKLGRLKVANQTAYAIR